MTKKSVDLGALQDRLHQLRRIKASTARILARAQDADLRAGDELHEAQSEFDAAYHSIRNR